MRSVILAAALASVSTAALGQSYQRTDTGIVVTPAQGPEGAIYLLTDEDDGRILRLVRGS